MKKEELLATTLSNIITSFPSYMSFFLENKVNCIKNPTMHLQQALKDNNIDEEAFFSSLEKISTSYSLPFSPVISLSEFTNEIYTHYHIPTRERSAALLQDITKFLEEDPSSNILELYNAFANEMEDHLLKEEKILFPLIQHYENSNELDGRQVLKCPMEKMESEHDHHQINLEALLKESLRIKTLSATGEAIYKHVEWLFLFTMEHVHIENNILFQRIRAS